MEEADRYQREAADNAARDHRGALHAYLRTHQRAFLLAVCAFAALRIFVFSAGFPLFNNVDEQGHFVYAWECANGHLPQGIEPIDPKIAWILAMFSTPEYTHRPDESGGVNPAPPWRASVADGVRYTKQAAAMWSELPNIEGMQPPLYYLIAGSWYRIGELAGLPDGHAIYWIRFLNIPLYILLILTAYLFLKRIYPGADHIYLGVPLMLAFLPQDTFFSISNCALSPLVYAAAFYSLALVALGRSRSYRAYAFAGLLAGGAILTQYTNATIIVAILIAAVMVLRRPSEEGSTGSNITRAWVMLLAAGAPVAVWCVRNYLTIHAFTAAGQYLEITEWTTVPLAEVFDHAIFTPAGIGVFWNDLMTTYFRGEFSWGAEYFASKGWDLFYAWSSLVFLVASGIWLARFRRNDTNGERFVDAMSMLVFLGSVMLLAGMSIHYYYGDWASPSTEHPYFSAGRLICGTLVPFLVLYIKGMDSVLRVFRLRINRLIVIAVIGIGITVSEALISIPAFESGFNWFHMF